MKFVLPYTKCRSQRDNIVVEDSTASHIQKIERDDYDEEVTSEPEAPPTVAIQTIMGNVPKKEVLSPTRFVFIPPSSSTPNFAVKRSATVMEQESEADNGTLCPEKKINVPPDVVVNKEMDDADLNFFKSLLPDIRQMTPTQKRKFKMGIFELINKIVD